MASVAVLCVHHHAARGGRCGAGVDVEQLRDAELRLPCLAINGVCGAVECDLREPPAAAANDQLGPLSELLERALAGCCPTCDEPIEYERQVGDAVVAWPCQHRIGRSRAS